MKIKSKNKKQDLLSKQTVEEVYNFVVKLTKDHNKAIDILNEVLPDLIDYNAIKDMGIKVELKLQAYSLIRLHVKHRSKRTNQNE